MPTDQLAPALANVVLKSAPTTTVPTAVHFKQPTNLKFTLSLWIASDVARFSHNAATPDWWTNFKALLFDPEIWWTKWLMCGRGINPAARIAPSMFRAATACRAGHWQQWHAHLP